MYRQKGMSLGGSLLVACLIIFFGVLLMKIIPTYLKNYEVRSSMRSLNTLSSDLFTDNEISNAEVLKGRLMNQLHVNDALDLTDQKITVTPMGQGHYRVELHYIQQRHLAWQMYLLFIFDETVEVAVGPK